MVVKDINRKEVVASLALNRRHQINGETFWIILKSWIANAIPSKYIHIKRNCAKTPLSQILEKSTYLCHPSHSPSAKSGRVTTTDPLCHPFFNHNFHDTLILNLGSSFWCWARGAYIHPGHASTRVTRNNLFIKRFVSKYNAPQIDSNVPAIDHSHFQQPSRCVVAATKIRENLIESQPRRARTKPLQRRWISEPHAATPKIYCQDTRPICQRTFPESIIDHTEMLILCICGTISISVLLRSVEFT